jgi:hypothetical protein
MNGRLHVLRVAHQPSTKMLTRIPTAKPVPGAIASSSAGLSGATADGCRGADTRQRRGGRGGRRTRARLVLAPRDNSSEVPRDRWASNASSEELTAPQVNMNTGDRQGEGWILDFAQKAHIVESGRRHGEGNVGFRSTSAVQKSPRGKSCHKPTNAAQQATLRTTDSTGYQSTYPRCAPTLIQSPCRHAAADAMAR